MDKTAFIELNEKQLKLKVVESRLGRFRTIYELSDDIDISAELFRDFLFQPKTRTMIVDKLKIYNKAINMLNVTKVEAYATSVLTSARNIRGFLDEIFTNTGLDFVVIKPEEVSKYIYNSVVGSVDFSKGYFIFVNADTTNFVRYNRRTIIASSIIPYGYQNVREQGENDEKVISKVKKAIERVEFAHSIEPDSFFVGAGTVFTDLAKISRKLERYPLDVENNYNLTFENFKNVENFTSTIDLSQVKKVKGISPNGAENILNGRQILRAFYEQLKISTFVVTTANLMHGKILSSLSTSLTEKFPDLLSNSLDNYYEFTKSEFSINDKVYSMALLLFKQLKVVHKLPRAYSRALRISAYMYDSGRRINPDNYERYCFDAVINSGVVGCTQKELLLGAFACLCQNLDNFNLSEWMKYKSILSDEDMDAVRKLGVLTKLAVALNASRKDVIEDIVCDILGDAIIIKTVVSSDPSFELMEGLKLSEPFKKVFKKTLQII